MTKLKAMAVALLLACGGTEDPTPLSQIPGTKEWAIRAYCTLVISCGDSNSQVHSSNLAWAIGWCEENIAKPPCSHPDAYWTCRYRSASCSYNETTRTYDYVEDSTPCKESCL